MEYNYDRYKRGELKLPPETDPGIYYDNKATLAKWILEKLKDPTLTSKEKKQLNSALERARYTGD